MAGVAGGAIELALGEVRVLLRDADVAVPEEIADLEERPAATPPAGDEGGAARVTEVVPAERARDAGGEKPDRKELDLAARALAFEDLPDAPLGRAWLTARAGRTREREAGGVLRRVLLQLDEPAFYRRDGLGKERHAARLAVLRRVPFGAESDEDVGPSSFDVDVAKLQVPHFALTEAREPGDLNHQARPLGMPSHAAIRPLLFEAKEVPFFGHVFFGNAQALPHAEARTRIVRADPERQRLGEDYRAQRHAALHRVLREPAAAALVRGGLRGELPEELKNVLRCDRCHGIARERRVAQVSIEPASLARDPADAAELSIGEDTFPELHERHAAGGLVLTAGELVPRVIENATRLGLCRVHPERRPAERARAANPKTGRDFGDAAFALFHHQRTFRRPARRIGRAGPPQIF